MLRATAIKLIILVSASSQAPAWEFGVDGTQMTLMLMIDTEYS